MQAVVLCSTLVIVGKESIKDMSWGKRKYQILFGDSLKILDLISNWKFDQIANAYRFVNIMIIIKRIIHIVIFNI